MRGRRDATRRPWPTSDPVPSENSVRLSGKGLAPIPVGTHRQYDPVVWLGKGGPGMAVLQTVWLFVRGFSAGRPALMAGDLALRHHIAVLQRSVKRPQLHTREAVTSCGNRHAEPTHLGSGFRGCDCLTWCRGDGDARRDDRRAWRQRGRSARIGNEESNAEHLATDHRPTTARSSPRRARKPLVDRRDRDRIVTKACDGRGPQVIWEISAEGQGEVR